MKKSLIKNIYRKVGSLATSVLLIGVGGANIANGAGTGINYSLVNPLAATSFEEVLLAILNVFIVVATPIIVLFIIYSGFLYVTASGNVEQTKKATTSLTYAIIGGVILLGAAALAEIVKNVVGAFTP